VAHFESTTPHERLSHGFVGVPQGTLSLGLVGPFDFGGNELEVVSSDPAVTVSQGLLLGDRRMWSVSGRPGARARIHAVTAYRHSWDHVDVEFAPPGGSGGRDFVVRPVTRDVVPAAGAYSFYPQTIATKAVIDVTRFRPGQPHDILEFRDVGETVALVGIFACRAGQSTRAVFLLLPRGQRPNLLTIGVTHQFQQGAEAVYNRLGWSNPVSVPFLRFVLQKFVVGRWGPQALAARTPSGVPRAMLLLGRSSQGRNEMGPFAADGAFLHRVLASLRVMTGNAFSFPSVEFFTYSSGITDLNPLADSASSHLAISAVINIDPARGEAARHPRAAALRQYLSGHTTHGHPRAGFEFMPIARWRHELAIRTTERFANESKYMHDGTMPNYCLYLGMQTL
jgi:hypothetical protein